jgi:hypothetical protein
MTTKTMMGKYEKGEAKQNVNADLRINRQDIHKHPNISGKLLLQLIKRSKLNAAAGASRKILKATKYDGDTLTRRLQPETIRDLTDSRGSIQTTVCVALHCLRKH